MQTKEDLSETEADMTQDQPKQIPRRANMPIKIVTEAGDDMISIFEFLYQRWGITVPKREEKLD